MAPFAEAAAKRWGIGKLPRYSYRNGPSSLNEQWFDGNNTLALAPDVVVATSAMQTNARLRRRGHQCLHHRRLGVKICRRGKPAVSSRPPAIR